MGGAPRHDHRHERHAVRRHCEAFLPDGDYCIGLNQNRPGTDSEPLIGYHRQWRFPGCYTWVKGGTPTKGSC